MVQRVSRTTKVDPPTPVYLPTVWTAKLGLSTQLSWKSTTAKLGAAQRAS